MKRHLMKFVIALSAAAAAQAQAPVITDVQDAGSYTAVIAQGSVFVVKGTNLATSSVFATAPYPTVLGGVSITFTPVGGGASVTALMVYTFRDGSVTQLAALLPAGTAAGDYNVVVRTGAGASAAFTVTVVVRKFGIITVPGSGAGRAVILNVLPDGKVAVNRFTSGSLTYQGTVYAYGPAYPGQTVITFGTGLGGTVTDSTVVIIGGQEVKPLYAGPSDPQYPGLDQINVTLPANVQTGCYVPFIVRVGTQISNATTISIAPNSSATACVDPVLTPDQLTSLDRGGTLSRSWFYLSSNNTTINLSSVVPTLKDPLPARNESATGAFAQITADNLADANAFFAPSGTCQVFHRVGGALAVLIPNTTLLDAGTVTLNGPNVTNQAFTEDATHLYNLNLGTAVTLPAGVTLPPIIAQQFTSTPKITTGTYSISGAGGKDVGKFGPASVTIPSPLTLANPLPASIPRAQNLTISWTGGGTNPVQIIGASGGPAADSTQANPSFNSQVFVCTTTADKGSFTVPASILAQLPATPPLGPAAANGLGFISVAMTTPVPANGNFTAPLTAGGTIPGSFVGSIGFTANTTYQ
ncbi:MAG: hypothetical protein C5B51_10745 [Terriglobia bacterium]|nr:MAG: hypothetical protein C5B51_10745 [Terriglobia bacterium]